MSEVDFDRWFAEGRIPKEKDGKDEYKNEIRESTMVWSGRVLQGRWPEMKLVQ